PTLNTHIVEFVKSKLNKKVGRGECWDLASEALNTQHAKWDGRYKYGTLVDYKTECVYPGDIIQFERVVVECKFDGGMTRDEMPHHTAVVYEVQSTGNFIIAHQNYNNKKKVVLTSLNMENIKRGKATIYRPVKKGEGCRSKIGQGWFKDWSMKNYNNRIFKSIVNTANGETSSETIFHYKQQGNVLTAEYSGGKILYGHLLGLVDKDGNIDMRYHQINNKGEMMTGICKSMPEILENGKIRLHESWQWTSGDNSKGQSVIEEQ
ncbi:MAG TPA: hypothetical protein VMZ69_11995, partial [Saprospiraceae bacterium]|nr:hypothetical protein [Saprospiraceae bacterium]